VASAGNDVTVWASLFLDPSGRPYGTLRCDFETGLGLTLQKIIESVKLGFGKLLQNVSTSDLHVFSGLHHARFLNQEEVWNVESHGGSSEAEALLVKVVVPFDMPNRGIMEGT
jgi:hypothetical protein